LIHLDSNCNIFPFKISKKERYTIYLHCEKFCVISSKTARKKEAIESRVTAFVLTLKKQRSSLVVKKNILKVIYISITSLFLLSFPIFFLFDHYRRKFRAGISATAANYLIFVFGKQKKLLSFNYIVFFSRRNLGRQKH
jgi:hypothetical protein